MRRLSRTLAPFVFLPALLLPAGAASASPANTVHSGGFQTHVNTCDGESVHIEGTDHVVYKTEKDGYFVYDTFHGQGVGTQGSEYVFNLTLKTRVTSAGEVGVQRFLLISKGTAPNLEFSIRYNTATHESSFEAVCRG